MLPIQGTLGVALAMIHEASEGVNEIYAWRVTL
jgi:hypothetical protein